LQHYRRLGAESGEIPEFKPVWNRWSGLGKCRKIIALRIEMPVIAVCPVVASLVLCYICGWRASENPGMARHNASSPQWRLSADVRRARTKGAPDMPVGRQELIKRVATKTNKSVKESTVFVNGTLESIREALQSGDAVRLVGFGVFSVKDTAPSVRVNPQTRQKINVPARKRVKFTPGKDLNDAVAVHAPAAKGKK